MKMSGIAANYRYGTGIIIPFKDKYVFAIGNEKFWKKDGSNLIITYTAVGGNLERGESFLDSARREAKEEIGVEIELVSSPNTLIFNLDNMKRRIAKSKDRVRPVIVYNKTLSSKERLYVYVYLSNPLKATPRSYMEVPSLLLLHKYQMIAKEDKKLEDLLSEGGEIVERRSIPRDAILKPFGSAEVLKQLDANEISLLSI